MFVLLVLVSGHAHAQESFFYPYRGIAMASFVVRPEWVVSYRWSAEEGVAALTVVAPGAETSFESVGFVTTKVGSRRFNARFTQGLFPDLDFRERPNVGETSDVGTGARCGTEGLFPPERIDRADGFETSTCWIFDAWTEDVVLSDLLVSEGDHAVLYARTLVRGPSPALGLRRAPPESRPTAMEAFLAQRVPTQERGFDLIRQDPFASWDALPEREGRWTLEFVERPGGALRIEARMDGLLSGISVELDHRGRPTIIENWAFGLADGTWVVFDWDHARHWRALFRFGQRVTERVGAIVFSAEEP